MTLTTDITTTSHLDLLLWQVSQIQGLPTMLPSVHQLPNPLIVDNLLLVSSFPQQALLAYSKSDGSLLWKTVVNGQTGFSPIACDGAAYCTSAHELNCVDLQSGSLLWTYVPRPGDDDSEPCSSPTIAGERVYFGDSESWLHCVERATGALLWKTSVDDYNMIVAPPVVHRGVVYAKSTGSKLGAFEANSGKWLWGLNVPGRGINDLFLCDEQLLFAADDCVYEVTLNGKERLVLIAENQLDQMIPVGQQIFCLIRRSSDGESKTSSYLLVYDSGTLRSEHQVHNHPVGLGLTSDGRRVFIKGPGGLVFFNLQTQTLECQIKGPFLGHPDFDQSRIFAITTDHEILCVRQPFGVSEMI